MRAIGGGAAATYGVGVAGGAGGVVGSVLGRVTCGGEADETAGASSARPMTPATSISATRRVMETATGERRRDSMRELITTL